MFCITYFFFPKKKKSSSKDALGNCRVQDPVPSVLPRLPGRKACLTVGTGLPPEGAKALGFA